MFMTVALPVIVIFAIMMVFGVPIYIVMLTATIYLQVFVNHMPLQNMFNGMFEALTKNSLLAIPFFVLAGNLMATGSLGTRLVEFVNVFLKKMPGGFAISCVGANAIFGAISGSAPAATGTFGKILWKPLREVYGDREAAGLITSSASLSPIIPPAMTMIIFGLITETSVAKLFIAGLMPGILLVIIMAVYLFMKYRKSVADVTRQPGERRAAIKQGVPALLLPVIILGGIYGGICSPTEAGAIAATYSFVVSIFIIRDIKIRQLPSIVISSAKTVGTVFILMASSNVFSQALTITQAPQALQASMSGLTPFTYLVLLNILLLILGCFIDPAGAMLIVVPLLAPIGIALGIDILHMGAIFAVNMAIGMFTPPFGLSLFVASDVLEKPISFIARGCVPYVFCYLIGLIFVTYIPEISLFLPRLLS